MPQFTIKGFLPFASIMLGLLMQTAVFATPLVPQKDIRVVIDMSGSMKKNDPQNHRIKAVRLFSTVLPDETLAGIWTFASEVNMLVKHQEVDKAWKKLAYNKSAKIHSHGLYTNIEKALRVATRNLHKSSENREKHIILLTDGYVDISKNKSLNRASRKRVIEEVLPTLKKSSIQVHTIALSQYADHELMKLLSYKTGGQYAVIHKAGDLDRYFFKLFEATAQPDSVPLKGNKFDIDASIKDMTIVLFNQKQSSRLNSPSKQTWSYEKRPKNIKWVQSDNYEIITVSKPETGTWTLDAPEDPDNKIMVVTNLKLHVNKLPTQLLPGDSLDIKVHLSENNARITKDDFIKLVYLKSVTRKKGSLARNLVDTQYTGDGYFEAKALSKKLKDKSILQITAKSPTFIREFRHEFTVLTNPVSLDSKILENSGIQVTATIDERALDTDNVRILLSDGESDHEMKRTDNKWQMTLPQVPAGKTYQAKIEAKLHDGRLFRQSIPVSIPELAVKKAAPVEITHAQKAPEKEPVKVVTEELTEEPTEDEQQPLNWIIIAGSVILFNILIGVGGYFAYTKLFKSKSDDDYLLLDDAILNTDETGSEDDSSTSQHNSDEETDDEVEDLDDLEDLEDLDDDKQASAAS